MLSIKCGTCGVSLKNNKTLKQHVQNVHCKQKPVIKCLQCVKTFTTECSLVSHVEFTHKVVECDICHKKFKNSNSLRTHRHSFHSKSCKSSLNSSKPRKTSEEDAEFSKMCPHCQLNYTSKSGFNKHMRKHHGTNIASAEEDIIIEESTVTVTHVDSQYYEIVDNNEIFRCIQLE